MRAPSQQGGSIEMSKHYPPVFQQKQFHCVYCGVYAKQHWQRLLYDVPSGYKTEPAMIYCLCDHCGDRSYWHEGAMVVPTAAPVELPHPLFPEACVDDFLEAREVVARSPRAAAALLRLALQKMMVPLGEKGHNINDDIKSLVAKGLPDMVKKALDFCRVVGNNAVHPGELSIDDTPEIAHALFRMLNFIVEDRIARPAAVDALYELLPEGARAAIEKRDAPTAK